MEKTLLTSPTSVNHTSTHTDSPRTTQQHLARLARRTRVCCSGERDGRCYSQKRARGNEEIG